MKNLRSYLLEHETLRIPHCHVEVIIGPSKLTANSHSLRYVSKVIFQSSKEDITLGVVPPPPKENLTPLPRLRCFLAQKTNWNNYLFKSAT